VSPTARDLERRTTLAAIRVATSLLLLVALASSATAHDKPAGAPSDGALAGYLPLAFRAPEPGTYELPSLGVAADGEVLDTDGRPLRLYDLLGDRLAVLSFIYTSCPEATGCPLATHALGGVRTRLHAKPDLAGQVRLLSLSFDPARDKPEAMRRYASSFAPAAGGAGRAGQAGQESREVDWRFLTGASEAGIAPLLAAYGQAVQRDIDANGEPLGTISHVLRVFLIDREKRIRNVYSASFLHADTLATDLETLALEEAASGAEAPKPGIDSSNAIAVVELAQRPNLLGLPVLPIPEDNPPTPAKVALGRKLFFDRRLSRNETFSCAMCHVPTQGFTSNEMATSVGIEGRTVKRNAPTILNAAYAIALFHDGRERRLEHQIWSPLLAANEMGNPSIGTVLAKLDSLDDYRGTFEAAFDGDGPSLENVGRAIASYERTLLAADSPFDRWHFGKDESAVGERVKRGFALFTGKAGCASCHAVEREHALFTDYGFYHTGIGYRAMLRRTAGTRRIDIGGGVIIDVDGDAVADASEVPPTDLGRYEITEDPADRWRYRTPSLRNVALTAPYMHDGSLATLDDVVAYYDAGGEPSELLDPRIRKLDLTDPEREDLVAFLGSLTGSNVSALVADALAAPVGERR
jgi:cytochrome c peroxidase